MITQICTTSTRLNLIIHKRLHRRGHQRSLHHRYLSGRSAVFIARHSAAILSPRCLAQTNQMYASFRISALKIGRWKTTLLRDGHRDTQDRDAIPNANRRSITTLRAASANDICRPSDRLDPIFTELRSHGVPIFTRIPRLIDLPILWTEER